MVEIRSRQCFPALPCALYRLWILVRGAFPCTYCAYCHLHFLPLILPCNGPCFDRPSRRSGVSVSNFPRTRASRVTLAHCGHCRRAVSIQPSGLNHFNEFPRAGCTIIEKILLFHCFYESAPSLHGSSNKSHNGSNTTPDGLKTGSKCPTRVPRRPRHAPQKILVRGLVLAVLLVVVHRPCVILIKIHAVGAI